MRSFQQFMSICEEVEDKSKRLGFAATIKTAQAGGRVRPERKKTPAEIRRMKAVGGGKMEPVGSYKPRKDIGSQRAASTRQQQPEQERGSARERQLAAAKEERRKAAQARAAAKKGGSATTTEKPKAKPKDLSKQASQLLSTKKAEEKPATRTNRKWRTETGGGMTKSERASARGKEKTAKAQETKKSSSEILAKMRKEYEEGGGKWSNAVAVRMRAKAKAAAQASAS
jgi:hypothetical protein